MAKSKKRRRRRSTTEKILIVLGILIALSMVLSLIVGLGAGGRSSNAPAPSDGLLPAGEPESIGALILDAAALAVVVLPVLAGSIFG
jgi:hypothetical protein